jgi:hypothetical protein
MTAGTHLAGAALTASLLRGFGVGPQPLPSYHTCFITGIKEVSMKPHPSVPERLPVVAALFLP